MLGKQLTPAYSEVNTLDPSGFDSELAYLTDLATAVAEEYRLEIKQLSFFLPLWVKVRRKGNTLQIEWERTFKNKNGIVRQYLPKGPSAKYDTRLLIREIKKTRLVGEQRDQAMQLVLSFEERFARIRKAAALLSKARQAFLAYHRHNLTALDAF